MFAQKIPQKVVENVLSNCYQVHARTLLLALRDNFDSVVGPVQRELSADVNLSTQKMELQLEKMTQGEHLGHAVEDRGGAAERIQRLIANQVSEVGASAVKQFSETQLLLGKCHRLKQELGLQPFAQYHASI